MSGAHAPTMSVVALGGAGFTSSRLLKNEACLPEIQ
jgi:hypothetical protein